MNKTIKTLFIQAGGSVEEENGNLWTYCEDLDPEKFAQLVIKECAGLFPMTLTDEEIEKVFVLNCNLINETFAYRDFARAILRKAQE
jgi:hypothetical protein